MVYLSREEFDKILSKKDLEIITQKDLNSEMQIINNNLELENKKLNEEINELKKFKNLYNDL